MATDCQGRTRTPLRAVIPPRRAAECAPYPPCRILRLFCAALVAAASLVQAEPLTLKKVGSARKMYVAKCAKCHKFYEPKNYSDADWTRWMGLMSQRSKLKAEQESLLRSYLEEYRAGRVEKVK